MGDYLETNRDCLKELLRIDAPSALSRLGRKFLFNKRRLAINGYPSKVLLLGTFLLGNFLNKTIRTSH